MLSIAGLEGPRPGVVDIAAEAEGSEVRDWSAFWRALVCSCWARIMCSKRF